MHRSARPSPVRRLRAALVAAGASLLLAVPLASPAGAAPTDAWSTPSGGRGNEMVNAGESSITSRTAARVDLAWRTPEGAAGDYVTPTVVGGTVYYVREEEVVSLVAASAATGDTLWDVELGPGFNEFIAREGVTVSGSLVLVPFVRPFDSIGIVAVDRYRRSVAWTSTVPGDTGANSAYSSHQVYADAARAYFVSDFQVLAYRLGDGRLEWSTRLEDNFHVWLALGEGVLFVGFDDTPGITAYSASTGRKLWTGPGQGRPVVTGGKVFAASFTSVHAVSARGCGKPTCPPLWSTRLPKASPDSALLGAADGRTLHVSYQQPAGGGATSGVLVRLSAATGAVQWTRTLGHWFGPPTRAGDVVWVPNAYYDSERRVRGRILGFSATGSRTASLRNLSPVNASVPRNLAVGGGTLLVQTHVPSELFGYRVR